jgi:hypothetical protein
VNRSRLVNELLSDALMKIIWCQKKWMVGVWGLAFGQEYNFNHQGFIEYKQTSCYVSQQPIPIYFFGNKIT